MQLTIKHEKKSPLLHRRELTAEIQHAGAMTPKNVDVKKALADHYKVGEDVVMIYTIQDSYGTTHCTVQAAVYETQKLTRNLQSLLRNLRRKKKMQRQQKQKVRNNHGKTKS